MSEWSIFDIREEDGWEDLQIKNRLSEKGIKCLSCDIWDKDLAYILGCIDTPIKISEALNFPINCIYPVPQYGLIILNLYQARPLDPNRPSPTDNSPKGESGSKPYILRLLLPDFLYFFDGEKSHYGPVHLVIREVEKFLKS